MNLMNAMDSKGNTMVYTKIGVPYTTAKLGGVPTLAKKCIFPFATVWQRLKGTGSRCIFN